MMNFNEFKEYLKKEMPAHLPPEYADCCIDFRHIMKMNGEYEAILFCRKDSNNAAALDLDSFYEEYKSGVVMDMICYKICLALEKYDEMPPISVEKLDDYNWVKEHLYFRITNYERTEHLLDDVPHDEIAEFTVTYYCTLGNDDEYYASTMITNNMLKHYGISEMKLHMDAVFNTVKKMPYVLHTMRDFLPEMDDEEKLLNADIIEVFKRDVFVLSNEKFFYGAGVLLYPGMLQKIARQLHSSYLIFPVSVHEVMLKRTDFHDNMSELTTAAKIGYFGQTDKMDFLSDNVYFYNMDSDEFGYICRNRRFGA